MSEWCSDLQGFKPEFGCEFSFLVEHEGRKHDHRCRVTEVVAGKKIAYTWRYEGYHGDSLVTYELFEEGGKTRLKLTHEGLDNLLPKYERSDFNGGWTKLLGEELPKYLASTESA